MPYPHACTQISFGKILTPLGLSMLTYGFGSFFNLLPGGDVSSLLLIYGFVISLLGRALHRQRCGKSDLHGSMAATTALLLFLHAIPTKRWGLKVCEHLRSHARGFRASCRFCAGVCAAGAGTLPDEKGSLRSTGGAGHRHPEAGAGH